MAINYEDLLARQEEARVEFGRVLREWRQINEWSVWDPARLDGSWTNIELGAYNELSPLIFIDLGRLNEQPGIVAISSAEYTDLLWSPVEFWALYCGLQTKPWAWRYP